MFSRVLIIFEVFRKKVIWKRGWKYSNCLHTIKFTRRIEIDNSVVVCFIKANLLKDRGFENDFEKQYHLKHLLNSTFQGKTYGVWLLTLLAWFAAIFAWSSFNSNQFALFFWWRLFIDHVVLLWLTGVIY